MDAFLSDLKHAARMLVRTPSLTIAAVTALALGIAVFLSGHARAQDAGYLAQTFNPAHAGLARSAGVPAQLGNEAYVDALARLVYYWA